MVARGWVGVGTVEGRLFDACRRNGLVNEDGEAKVRATLRSGIKAGIQNPHPDLRDRPNDKTGHSSDSRSPNQSSARTFDDPDWSILDDRRGELPEFPLPVFSEKIQELIRRTAEGAGVTPAHVAVPLIGIVSGLIGYSRRVKVTNAWLQPTTCWTAVIGYSGTGKTPGFNTVRKALKQLERDNLNKELERERKHETKKAAARVAQKIWNEQVE
jgi:hypothetical protein